ncbi:MAG: hypothetical protein IJX17_04705 [Clostridia bacterium]|nr:hypothetical protein [Clostridia bacterium]
MNRFNTNYFLNFLNEHIKNIKVDAERIASAKIVNFNTIKTIFRMSEIETLSFLKKLSDSKVIDWNIISNNIIIDIKDRESFVNYVCAKKKYETQIMYLKLCGKINAQKLAEVFQISNLDAQILYSKILSNSGYVQINSNDYFSTQNIEYIIPKVSNFAKSLSA